MIAMSSLQIASFFVEDLLGKFNSEFEHYIAAFVTVAATIFMYWFYFKFIVKIRITKLK